MNLFEPYINYSLTQIYLEIFACLCGIISVLYIKYKNILGYPIGILSTIIYTYLLFQWGLFGDMMINFYYTIMSFYGWILWNNSKKTNEKYLISKIKINEIKNLSIVFSLSFFLILGIYYLKNTYFIPVKTPILLNFSIFDLLDSLTTSIFIIGMYLMAKIKLEHWIFWIVGNFICIFLFHLKGYDITAIQYFIFCILAIFAYFQWLKEYKNQT